jgi:serine/threonine protein kinase
LWVSWPIDKSNATIEKVVLRIWKKEVQNGDNQMTNDSTYIVSRKVHEDNLTLLLLARDSRTKVPVFIKAPKPGNTQIGNEIRILSRVQHPYIIPVKDVISTPAGRAIVFPFALAGDLLDRIMVEPVNESQARVILWKMLKALEHIHAQGILHRDLKPENILIMSSDVTDVLLADFGLARFASFHVCRGDWAGTDQYMAPEMLGEHPYTSAVDVWSLGVVFYVIATGWNLFDFSRRVPVRAVEMRLRHLLHDRRLKILSPVGRDLLIRMLKFHPMDRISVRDALQHPWFEGN